MSFCSRLCRLILILWLLSIVSTLALIFSFTLYVGLTLYREYLFDQPGKPGSQTEQAQIDRFLYPDRPAIHQLTSYNYKSLLDLSPDQNFIQKDNSHVWIYLTGRQTCEDDLTDSISPEVCEKWDENFDDLASRYYVHPPAWNASIYTLDCNFSPLLCNAWAVSPPGLLRLESLGAPHCNIQWQLFPALACPFGVRFIPLPTGNGFVDMIEAYRPVGAGLPDEKWQLQTLFESSCAHEVYEPQRLLEYVGNGGDVQELKELVGDLVVGFPVAEVFGMAFSWWLGDGTVQQDAEL